MRWLAGSCLILATTLACGQAEESVETPSEGGRQPQYKRVVVLGIDGLDPDILKEVMELHPERMQNFRALAKASDGIQNLGTSTPPQSPVAWSSFITGVNPGGHGVFDFIHRDPKTYSELPGTQKPMHASDFALPGSWKFPLTEAGDSNRTGRAFWTVLGEQGVPASVWRMPINFPVEKGLGYSFPGMLTPAIDSAYGQPTLYTTSPPLERLTDPKVKRIQVRNGRVRTHLMGPANPFKDGEPAATIDLDLFVDAKAGAVAIELGTETLLLKPGQWSVFVPVEFSLLPVGMNSMSGIVRFYLRSVEPELELYASPVDIDPMNPVSPISDPEEASAELAQVIGLYYTQGMAEDVNGLKKGLLTDEEFMAQTELVFQERGRMLDYALDKYMRDDRGGLLFFYYSTVDLCAHMMWRHSDEEHPNHDIELAAKDSQWWSGREGSTWKDVLIDLYLKMDGVLGEVRASVGEDTLILVMSDHGFAPYHRVFSLNTWLLEKGYLVLKPNKARELARGDANLRPVRLVDAVDWTKTKAYGLGFNGLYLNLKGREAQGIVELGREATDLIAELKAELEALKDGALGREGTRVVLSADLGTEVYSGQRVAEAPDLVVGYNSGYGNSDESSLARIPNAVLRDNLGGTFNGNHLMHPSVVPGTLLTNGALARKGLKLEDVTAQIFALYGVEPETELDGQSFLK
ncbi:MAG: putative AlkP superfamily phosphohydrolase/phosphomutase [Planctomycetota bacterium]|jgi:predicted AlkP superfamily phosphohydrolase/phosphomutase